MTSNEADLPRHGRCAALAAILTLMSACGGGGGGGGGSATDNVVDAAVSPAGTVTVYTGQTQSISIDFTTSDGALASALSVSVAALPAGWTQGPGSSSCASVEMSGSCTVMLEYAPTAPASGTLDLPFSYRANNGTAKNGSVAVAYVARSVTLHLLSGSTGGPGNLDGAGAAARFNSPVGVVADSVGNVYVLDGDGLVRKIAADHSVSTIATIYGSSSGLNAVDPPGYALGGIAIDADNNLYIASGPNQTIDKLTPDGVLTTLAGTAGKTGSADGNGASATFAFPAAIAVNSAGTIYVADSLNNEIRQISPEGTVTTLAGSGAFGSADGTGAAAHFWRPGGVAVNSSGLIYVSDTQNNTIRQITPQGVVTTLAGIVGDYAWADGTGTAAAFDGPTGMTVDSDGNLFVVDEGQIIRKITPLGVVTTPLGTPEMYGSADGAGAAARFFEAHDVAAGPGNVLYVADAGNDTLREISTADVVTTIAGLASPPGPKSQGITADTAGNVYVAEPSGLVKISPQGTMTTILPTSTSWPFVTPVAAAVASDGTVYVSGDNIVQKISPQGQVSLLAGEPGVSGSADGTGSAARFNGTAGIAINGAGTIYVVDSGNDTIRAITPQGVVSTLAGAPGICCVDSVDGTGSAAHFDSPFSMAIDGSGNLYVGEGQGVIRKVTAAGVVTTLISGGTLSFNGGTGPSNLAFDAAGNLYIADEYNQVVRKYSPQGSLTTVVGSADHVGIALAPLPASLADPFGVTVLPSGELALLDGFAVLETQGIAGP